MVRINKNSLPETKVKQLHRHMSKIIAEMPSEKIDSFMQTLLGPEELLMIAKRLAVIVMLNEGYSHYRIAETLKLSQSTIQNIQKRQGKNSGKGVAETLTNHKDNYIAILKIIDSLLHAGGIMPHRTGLDRYRGL
jgi:uncharacterized protein YerC